MEICFSLFWFLDLVNTYLVHVFTGTKRGAGTNANVTITLFGEQDDSGPLVLDNDRNNFEKGRKDTFTLECPHLGKMKKIRIGKYHLTADW